MENNSMFLNADLTVYTDDGDILNFTVSKMQLFIIFRILGFRFKQKGEYSCYPDKTLEELLKYKGNPLNLVEKE